MAELTKSLNDIAWEALKSNKCICGTAKATMRAFCFGCWSALPKRLQKALAKA